MTEAEEALSRLALAALSSTSDPLLRQAIRADADTVRAALDEQ